MNALYDCNKTDIENRVDANDNKMIPRFVDQILYEIYTKAA